MHQTEETLWKTSPVASGVKLNERSTVRTSHQQSGGGRVPVGGGVVGGEGSVGSGLWFSWRRASVRGLRNRQFMLEIPSPDKRGQTFPWRGFLQMRTFDKPDEGGP